MENLPTWEETTPVAETLPTWEETKPVEQPKEATFMQGLKAGALDQPSPLAPHWYSPASVGHFVGAAALPTAGAALGSVVPVYGTALGAAAGEAAKKGIGRTYEAATGKEFKQESPLKTGVDVAMSGALQKGGELAGPMLGKGIEKAGATIGDVSGWMGTKIGKVFLKASQKLNAYGHNPVKAINDENIMAGTWEGLVEKVAKAKSDLGEQIGSILSKPENQKSVNIDNAVSPINEAISKLKKYPFRNRTAITELEGLKGDILSRINQETIETPTFEAVSSAGKATPEAWTKDILSPANMEHGVSVPEKGVQGHWYNTKSSETSDLADDVIDTVKTGTTRKIPVAVANEIKQELYGLARYTGNPSDDKVVNKAVQYVAAKINSVVGDAVPELKPINARYGNVIALDKAVKARAAVAERNDIIGMPEFFGAGAAATGKAALGAGIVIGNRAIKTPAGATIAMQGLKGVSEGAKLSAPLAGEIGGAIASKAGAISTPAIEKATERSPHDVKADYKSGKITREQAISELKGYGFK